MGWAHGVNNKGREVGYSVEAECDHPECDTKIDRGLDYACGGMHDEDGFASCDGYFCELHQSFPLFPEGYEPPMEVNSLCMDCCNAIEESVRKEIEEDPRKSVCHICDKVDSLDNMFRCAICSETTCNEHAVEKEVAICDGCGELEVVE